MSMEVIRDVAITNPYLMYQERSTTEHLVVVFHPIPVTPKELFKEQRLLGMFDMGVHFVVDGSGNIYSCLPLHAYADVSYKYRDDSIYIIMLGCSSFSDMSDAQQMALKDIKNTLNIPTVISED